MSADLAGADLDEGLLDRLPDAVLGWDLDRGIVHWNRGAVDLYGFSRADALGRRPAELFSTQFEIPLVEMLDCMAADGHWHGDLVHRAKDGRELTVESRWIACYDEDGALSGAMAIDRDVSTRIQDSYGRERGSGPPERERRQARLQNAERLEPVSELAGAVAHEFNNVLAIIINYTALVAGELEALSRASDDERWAVMRGDLGEIRVAAERAAQLTDQLRTFARNGRGVAVPIDLDHAIGQAEQLLRETVGEQIELVIVPAGDLREIRIDPEMLAQALAELAANSRDAMPHGGTLQIDTANVEIDAAFAAARPELLPGSHVRLRVCDTGGGMATEVLERAFDPFFTTKTSGNGSGLGLAAVFGTVRQARGHAQLDSEPGVGTTFTALIPAREQPARAPARTTGSYGVETILLVEDEDALRVVTERILTHAGYSVLGAATGHDALKLAAAQPGQIDLLLTDIRMPGMSGEQLAMALNALRPGLRVLYMSGFAGTMTAPATQVERGDLLEKPFTAAALLERVAAAQPVA